MNTLNEYKLLTPLQNKNAGFSRWAYAARFGEEYFIKEFMNPVYPDEESLSETLRNSKIKSCEYFEAKKLNLYKRINDVSDGNLVRVFEFFRCDSHRKNHLSDGALRYRKNYASAHPYGPGVSR